MQKNGLIKEAEHIDYEWHDGKIQTIPAIPGSSGGRTIHMMYRITEMAMISRRNGQKSLGMETTIPDMMMRMIIGKRIVNEGDGKVRR